MAGFKDRLKEMRAAIKDLAESSWSEHKEAALSDGREFIKKARKDLERWTKLVAQGKLTREEFEFLLRSKKDLATLEALKQEGLAAARLAGFRRSLFRTILAAVFKS